MSAEHREPVTGEMGSGTVLRRAHVASLREFQTPSLEAVERRRSQLWIRTATALLVVLVGVVVTSTWPQGPAPSLPASTTRAILVVLAAGAFAFAARQEVHLGRLSRMLTDERVLTAALTNRLHEVEVLSEVGREMNSILEMTVLLRTILASATDLLGAGGGSVMLLRDGELEIVQMRGRDELLGQRVRLGEGVAGQVALRREPILIDGTVDREGFPGLAERDPYVDSSMSVPLIHQDRLVGVLNVNAPDGHAFTQHDLRALAVFAGPAAGAIENAARYEAERAHVTQLRDETGVSL
ncbi:MAG: GAF domain-containing protein [Actinomycetota bacterium]